MNQENSPQEQHNIERIIEEVVDLLQFTVENADKPIDEGIPKDFFARLEKLEKEVQEFCSANDALTSQYKEHAVHFTNPTPEIESEMQSLANREQRILERVKSLQKTAEEKKKFLQQMEALAKAKGESLKKRPDEAKNPIIARKKQFNRVGGKKGWKPL